MRGGEGRHLRRVGLTGRRIGLRREQLLVEALAVSDQENRNVDHRRSPLLAGVRPQAQRHGEHGRRSIRNMRVAAGEREAAGDGHAAGGEHGGLGQPHALAIAVEAAGDANALGMVAPEARMGAAVHLLEPVDETRLAEAAGRQPAGHEGKADRDGENAGADRGQSHQRAPVAQRRQPVALR